MLTISALKSYRALYTLKKEELSTAISKKVPFTEAKEKPGSILLWNEVTFPTAIAHGIMKCLEYKDDNNLQKRFLNKLKIHSIPHAELSKKIAYHFKKFIASPLEKN